MKARPRERERDIEGERHIEREREIIKPGERRDGGRV